ncbi:MAG: oligosaccharide flippase family protein [Gaiellaceae bacterium]
MSLAKNAAGGMATGGAVFALGIIVSVVLTRSLGPEARGVYYLLVTTNLLLATLVEFGVGAALSTFVARGRFGLGELNSAAVLVAAAAGVVAFAAATIAFPFLRGGVFRNLPYSYVVVALVLVALVVYQSYWNAMMIGAGRIALLNKANLALNVLNALLIVLLVGVFEFGIPGFLASWAISMFIGAVGEFALLDRLYSTAWRPKRATLAALLGFGVRAQGRGIGQQLFLRFDMYALNALVGTRSVGVYSLSTSLAERLWMPAAAITAASAGKIAELPREESARLTARVTRASILIMIALAAPFAVASPWLIPFMYGQRFSAAVLPLVILLAGTLCFAANAVVETFLVGQLQRPGLVSLLSGLEFAISIGLYTGLILWHGIVGAAIASTVTYALALALTLAVFTRESALSMREILVPSADDFRQYLRVLSAAAGRIGVVGRPSRQEW